MSIMVTWTEQLVDLADEQFRQAADSGKAKEMVAYMKDHFDFYGITSPERKEIMRDVLSTAPRPTEADLIELTRYAWVQPQREWQYLAVDIVRQFIKVCGPDMLAETESLITQKSWWDTVDAIASNIVGPLVKGDLDGRLLMDEWLDSGNLWLARSALLHQLKYKNDVDAEWLFAACLQHAAHKDFFMRKAIGWSLRQLGRTSPDAVRKFVAENESVLSGLSKREALKHLK